MSDEVLLDVTDGVLVVTLNRPRVLNAINDALLFGLADAADATRDESVRAVVITGAGRGFCSGADLTLAGASHEAAGRGVRFRFNPVLMAWAAVTKPIVSAINGVAVGGGLSMALLADIRIASSAASFKPAFLDLGVAPDAGGSYFVTRLLGYGRALEFFLDGTAMTAEQAVRAGLVNRTVEPEALMDDAMRTAAHLGRLTDGTAGLTRNLVAAATTNTISQQLDAEVQTVLALQIARSGATGLRDERYTAAHVRT